MNYEINSVWINDFTIVLSDDWFLKFVRFVDLKIQNNWENDFYSKMCPNNFFSHSKQKLWHCDIEMALTTKNYITQWAKML